MKDLSSSRLAFDSCARLDLRNEKNSRVWVSLDIDWASRFIPYKEFEARNKLLSSTLAAIILWQTLNVLLPRHPSRYVELDDPVLFRIANHP